MNNSDTHIESGRSPSSGGWLASLGLAALAAALLLLSLKLPLWHMRLEAPQYRGKEALHIAVHPNALRGDLRELSVLNQYIGVHVPSTLPEFKWLPWVLIAGAGLGFLAGAMRKSIRAKALVVVAVAIAGALALAALQARSQIYKIGHDRNPHAPLADIQDFTPPFLGTTRIAQFEVSSSFGWGAWLIGGALLLQLAAAWASREGHPRREISAATESAAGNESAAANQAPVAHHAL